MIMRPTGQHAGAGTRRAVAIFSFVLTIAVLLAELGTAPLANAQSPPAASAAKIPPDQLASLVAPIALYPDPLLAQTLAASTYPLEIIQLQQFLARNSGLKEKALADAVEKEPWDPSVQALAGTPDVVKRLADDIQWTTDLGNAFLAQESDVMAAVQRMRKSAKDKNVLKTTEQQVVVTKVVESEPVVVIEPANPQVIYVPSYSPEVIWGAPAYPYPPIYYPPPGSVALAFGVGLAMGAWWGNGGGGWNCGWGSYGGNVNINNNNNFVRNSNVRNGGNVGGGNRWQHRPEHRGGAPYRDRATADRFGGAARGDSAANRQSNARNQIGRQGGNVASQRPAGGGDGRVGGGNNGPRGGAGNGPRGGGGDGRVGGDNGPRGGAGNGPRGGGVGGDNGPRGGAGNGPRGGAGAGGADRVGNRDVSRNSAGGGGGSRNGFGGGGGYNGSSARASSNRGSASAQSRGGGGRGGGGGGGRGGGSRGGGGRRR